MAKWPPIHLDENANPLKCQVSMHEECCCRWGRWTYLLSLFLLFQIKKRRSLCGPHPNLVSSDHSNWGCPFNLGEVPQKPSVSRICFFFLVGGVRYFYTKSAGLLSQADYWLKHLPGAPRTLTHNRLRITSGLLPIQYTSKITWIQWASPTLDFLQFTSFFCHKNALSPT